jgi:hypothetical protein
VNTSTHITKTPPQWKTHTHTHTHTLQNLLQQPQYKIHTKWNGHNTVRYPQCKVTLMYVVLLSSMCECVTLVLLRVQVCDRVSLGGCFTKFRSRFPEFLYSLNLPFDINSITIQLLPHREHATVITKSNQGLLFNVGQDSRETSVSPRLQVVISHKIFTIPFFFLRYASPFIVPPPTPCFVIFFEC